MKVLAIGTDRKLFDKNSNVAVRNIYYGEKTESVYIIVLSLKSNKFEQISLSEKVKVYPTNSSTKFGYIFDAIKIGKKIILEEKFVRGKDVISCQDPFESGLIGWRIARKFKLPFQLQIHTDFLSPYFKTSILQKIRVILAKFLIPKASGLRVVSKKIKDSIVSSGLKTRGPVDILPIRPNIEYINDVTLSPESDLKKLFPKSNFIILMASRLTPEKRILDALVSFKEVVKKYPSSLLCIAGEGPLKPELNKKVTELGLSENVKFLGWRDDVLYLMKSASMFLSTSEFEGYGMTLIEAGLSKCPVLSTEIAISGDILIHNKNSYICPVGDTLCISEGIEKFIENNAFRYELSSYLESDLRKMIPTMEDYSNSYVGLLEKISTKI